MPLPSSARFACRFKTHGPRVDRRQTSRRGWAMQVDSRDGIETEAVEPATPRARWRLRVGLALASAVFLAFAVALLVARSEAPPRHVATETPQAPSLDQPGD